ncbi:phenylacetate--CoA ligase family protein [Colwellia sp. Bg11-12]|uniref:phenylacetate--CoA ligase family protein n=1 Tax=Colwellia sp. Bg11-12 TaxID=2759817 RepID=UPI0015F52B94|nr:phenylacetate--CoA ligase family protein [Colwellia sp. Bg11-12]MBA6265139.1 phenylacetate--CoA ligase family protein [Colwellia sp. Bg11-12]
MYSNIFRNFIMPAYEKIRCKNLLHFLDAYESRLTWSKEQLQAYQLQQLKSLLHHAYNNTSYYKDAWAAAGITDIDDIQSLADFEKLPVVTKDDIRNHYQDFISTKHANNIKKSTGGSTGQPFHFELDLESNTRREAVMWRGYGWLGAGLGQKTLYLWGADLGQPSRFKTIKNALYHGFYNRKMLNSFEMNKQNMVDYIDSINSYKPIAFVSYVNPLYELARYIIDHKIKVHQPKTMLTGAEPLHQFQREVIEQAFNCSVYDTFGCREFMLMSAECREHKSLHINCDHLVVETVNEEFDTVKNESGDLLITDLHNYGFPLIRYVNGDRATLVEEPCPCGNPLPIMKSVDGRKLDIIKTPTGGSIPGELFPHLFKEYKGIIKFQIKQTVINALDIFIITNDQFTEDDKQNIREEINKYSKMSLQLNFHFVDEIPLTAAGKHRVTICEI